MDPVEAETVEAATARSSATPIRRFPPSKGFPGRPSSCMLTILPRPAVGVFLRAALPSSCDLNRLTLTSGVWVVVKLRVRSGESIQDAVRRFRKLCERSGLRKEMRRKAYYEKPSERRRREELKRLRKARQAARV